MPINTLKISASPWTVAYTPYSERHGGDTPAYRVLGADRRTVCDINGDTPEEVQAAHARLIAAAPDLYDALEYFFNIMHDYESSRQKGYIRFACDRARAALARAGAVF